LTTLHCDKCERTFEVDPARAGEKVNCPHCGDVNRVPSGTVGVTAGAVASAAQSTTAEQALMTIRPAMFRAHPFKYSGLLILFLAGLALVIGGLTAWIAGGFFVIIPGAILMIVIAVVFLRWWIRAHLWLKVVVTNKRTVRHEGIVRRHTTEVLHNHVRSVDIRQSFLDRLLNVGSIGIDSAGQDEIEIKIDDIPGPYRVKEIVDRHRRM
jgi:membrane protein YdbS with pleckstrin-like domain